METAIREVMDRAVADGEVAGCNALILKDGKEIAYAESGWQNVEKQLLFRRDTIIRLYSMTKPITSAAVMLLMDRGLIDLEDAVERFIPEFRDTMVAGEHGRVKPARSITLRDLMNMVSGAVYPGTLTEAERQSAVLFDDAIRRLNTDHEMTTMELIRGIAANDLAFQPGATFKYGTGADILGAVVETVAGMRYGDFLRKEIFEPLGMTDTDFWVPEAKRSRLADVYASRDGELVPDHTRHLAINYEMDHSPAFESGGAGLCSTLDDYARFARMLMNGGQLDGHRLLSERAVRFMTNGSILPYQQSGLDTWDGLTGYTYGNLMRVLRDPSRSVTFGEAGEYGWDGWLGAYFANDPVNHLTILMGMQKIDAGTWSLTRKIRNQVYRCLN